MPERQYLNLSKRIVDRLAVDGKDAVSWDRKLPGFGVRVYPSGRNREREPAQAQENAHSCGRGIATGLSEDRNPEPPDPDRVPTIDKARP